MSFYFLFSIIKRFWVLSNIDEQLRFSLFRDILNIKNLYAFVEEELSVYDLLFSDNLSRKDIQAIKKVAVDVLAKVKSKIAELDHWTDKQETRATVDNLIRDTLWEELPECYDELSISGYRQKIYEYVYTRYKEAA